MAMKMYITFLLTITFLSSNAQIKFERGYFIDNKDNKINCLIKNRDWNNNPKEFSFKLTENDNVQEGTLENVKEFAIGHDAKFVRADVDMDRSSNVVPSLSKEKKPIFNNERHFLKVVFQGVNTLFSYQETGLTRFFYKTPSKPITQLVYKRYISMATEENKQEFPIETRENNTFRNQLWSDMRCASTNMAAIEKLKYTQKALLNFFKEIDACSR